MDFYHEGILSLEMIVEKTSHNVAKRFQIKDRENEGDLIIPGEMISAEMVNFMATHGRGLICLALTSEKIDQLNLPLMANANSSRHETAFTISIEAKEGVTTGISAHDRAKTIKTAINPKATPQDISFAFRWWFLISDRKSVV